MPKPRVRTIAWIAAAVVLVAAAAVVVAVVIRRAEDPKAPTAWDKVMSMADKQGNAGVQMALQAFALVYGPVPGVTPPSGSAGPGGYAGMPANWILSHWDALSADQQKAVAGYLRLDLNTVHSGRLRAAGEVKRIPSLSLQKCNSLADLVTVKTRDAPKEFTDLVAETRPKVELVVGKGFDAKITVCVADEDLKGDVNTFAETLSEVGSGGSLECRITYFPYGSKQPATSRLEITAHELTHCMNARIASNRADPLGLVAIPSWIDEGICNWVAYRIAGATPNLTDWWKKYLANPRVPLFQRSYDAFAFFQHIENVRADMAQSIVRTVGIQGPDYSSKALDAVTSPNREAVLNTHASSFLGWKGRGAPVIGADPWFLNGPGLFSGGLQITKHDLVNDGGPAEAISAGLGDGDLIEINIQADIVMITSLDAGGGAFGRFGPGASGDFQLDDAIGKIFCAKQGGCKCPDGKAPEIPLTQIDGGQAFLAVTGGLFAAGASAVGYSLDKFCREKPKPQKLTAAPSGGGVIVGAGCGGRCASTGGEPHQRTFDGYGYDMQAVGEFVLTKSTVDDFQVQTRTTPVPKTTTASMNTATAMNVAGDRVAIYTTPDSATLKVNGSLVNAGENGQVNLPKGGKVQASGGGIANRPSYEVTWPDGTFVGVETYLPWGIGVRVGLPESRYGNVTGQLGDADGVPGNDFKTRDGRQLAQSLSWEDFYQVFVGSWRLSTSESLFDYDAGQNTETFTDKTFPKEHVDPKTLPGRAEAETICKAAGITDPAMLENCIFDIVMTGDKVFADINADLQKFYAGSKLLKDGDSVSGTLSGTELNRHGLDVGEAKAFFLTDWSGTIDPCKATLIIEGALGYQTKCENKVLQVGLPSKPSGPLALSVGNSGTPGSYKFTFVTAKIRNFTIKPGDKVTGNIDVRGRVDVYYLDATQVTGISNRPETCNSIYAEHTNTGDAFGLSGVFGYVLSEVPICGNPRTLITTNDKQGQHWVLVVRSRDVSTGAYAFTFG
jgi:hypothetical protein